MPAPSTNTAKPLVSLNDVSVRFGPVAALEHISLKLNAGEIITAIGPNGAGKSTLIKLIVGLEQPTEGSVARTRIQTSHRRRDNWSRQGSRARFVAPQNDRVLS